MTTEIHLLAEASGMAQWLGSIAAVATAVGIFIAVWQILLAKAQKRTEFEDDLWREYREIAALLPLASLLGESLSDEDMAKHLMHFYRYIDLCNEQVFLRQQGRVSQKTWTIWRDGIRSNLHRPALDKAWIEIKRRSNTDFAELRWLEQHGYTADPCGKKIS